MFECQVTLTIDLSIVLTILNPHDQILITPAGLPLPVPAPVGKNIEMVCVMYWPPGVATSRCKFTSTVKHLGSRIMLDQHDLGPLLPHIPVPLNDIYFPLHILSSKRKVNFTAGMVLANGAPIACTYPIIFPMTGCANPVSLPTAQSFTNVTNTVLVNMHWIDVLAGWVQIAADAACDYIKGRMSEPGLPTMSRRGAAREGWEGTGFDPAGTVLDNVFGNFGAAVRYAGRHGLSSDYHGQAQLQFGVQRGQQVGTSLSVTESEDGLSFQHQVSGPGGSSGQGGLVNQSTTATRGTDGRWTGQSATTVGGATYTRSFPGNSETDGGSQSWLGPSE
jgi:hypothetical protein